MPRPSRRFVALALGLLALTVAPSTASAQADPFQQEIANAQAALEAAQAEAHAAAAQLAAAQEQLAAVEAQITAVQARIAEIEAQIPVLRAEVKRLRQIVRERAAALYRNAGPGNEESVPLNPSIEAVRRQILTDAAAKQDDKTMDELDAAVEQLHISKQDLTKQHTQLAEQQQQLTQLQQQLVSQQAALDQKVAIANQALERARAIGALRARGQPVQGPTLLTASQMAGWWHTRGYEFRVPGQTIESLAQIFVEEGQAEGVRGDLAFAQSIVETGGFRAAPANNFAGLGWCDSCSTGRRFPTARDGVRAQIQHLKNYADITSRTSGLAYPPSPYWYGSNPETARRNFDTFFAKGWAPTWSDMGKGNWATDRTYSSKVLNVYADMVAYAQTHA